jgi:hypothetical protein
MGLLFEQKRFTLKAWEGCRVWVFPKTIQVQIPPNAFSVTKKSGSVN